MQNEDYAIRQETALNKTNNEIRSKQQITLTAQTNLTPLKSQSMDM